MHSPHADVAELADAQVSEACDGDIVEVQVLSSAPILQSNQRVRSFRSRNWDRFAEHSLFIFGTTLG
jgi:hypothetical protein